MFGLFQINFKQILIVVLLLALPLISINLERRDSGNLRWYDRPLTFVMSPIQEVFSRFSQGVSKTTSHYVNLLNIKTENRVLKEELEKARAEISKTQEIAKENERLIKLLKYQELAPTNLVPAQVLAVDLWSPDYITLKINKGANSGIKKGMGVVTYDGIVGYVLNTQGNFSTVLSVTDRNAVIDAMIQRTRARGVAEGMGRDAVRLKYLQRTDDVQNGDLVITSGQDGTFPKGLKIGTVVNVSTVKFGVSQKVELRPIVDISRVEELLVVLNSGIQIAQPAASPEPAAEATPVTKENGKKE